MTYRRIIIAILIIITTAISLYITVGKVFQNKSSVREIYIGAWTSGFINNNTQEVVPNKLIDLENKINKKFAIAHFYRGWEHLEKDDLHNDLNIINSQGWIPLLSTNPYFFENCKSSSTEHLYKAIAQGDCDEFIHNAGKNLSKLEHPIYFRFAWEMNVYSISWSTIKTGDIPKDYISAWQRIHKIFRQEGAKNITWVFSPNINTPDSIPYNELYPGDEYVDWIGLDGYNWGDTQSWSIWESFDQVFNKSYTEITTLAPTKPLMIAEINSTNIGGNKASWYTDMLEVQLIHKYPQIKAVIFFDEDKSFEENVNWRIDIDKESLQSFRKGIQNSTYKSKVENIQ